MRTILALLAAGCAANAAPSTSADLSVPDAGYSDCVHLADGGIEIAADAGYFGDDGLHAGPAIADQPFGGPWRVWAPLCYHGELDLDGNWTCPGSAAWTGSVVPERDAYFDGGVVLAMRPDPAHWTYPAKARVVSVSAAGDLKAVLLDGYWGFRGTYVFLCKP